MIVSLPELMRVYPPLAACWEVAQLARAVFLYRNKVAGSSEVVKFYSLKTKTDPETNAAHEFDCINRVRYIHGSDPSLRPVRAVTRQQSLLVLEHVEGRTLEEVIALPYSRGGVLEACLQHVADFLAALHSWERPSRPKCPFEESHAYARNLVIKLQRSSTISTSGPIRPEELLSAFEHWSDDPSMRAFRPALIHGDPTTTNFLHPRSGGMVALDWEYLTTGDPAADVGRLMAEVSHSLKLHHPDLDPSPLLESLLAAYHRTSDSETDRLGFHQRACFHQAIGSLRIARNEWLSPEARSAAVRAALAVLGGGQ